MAPAPQRNASQRSNNSTDPRQNLAPQNVKQTRAQIQPEPSRSVTYQKAPVYSQKEDRQYPDAPPNQNQYAPQHTVQERDVREQPVQERPKQQYSPQKQTQDEYPQEPSNTVQSDGRYPENPRVQTQRRPQNNENYQNSTLVQETNVPPPSKQCPKRKRRPKYETERA